MSISPWALARYLQLQNVSRLLGRDEIVRLVNPAAIGRLDYSLEPFIQTNSIFVHVPKTGGTSICRALYGTLGMGHLTLREYREIFRPRALRGMFKFAFVRNPFDRVHSAYNFLRSGGMDEEDREFGDRVLSRYRTFERFVIEGLQKEEVASFWHFRPQTDYLASEDGLLHDLDFIGRYENFDSDFDHVRGRLNAAARAAHLNRTAAKDSYRRAYTPEMVDAVARKYAASFDLLGYDFDGPKRPIKLAGGGGLESVRQFAGAFQLRQTPLSRQP